MYLPDHFAQSDPDALQRLMRDHPLGTLVHPGPDGPDADHLPFEYDPSPADGAPLGLLRAHVARANPLWQRCPTGTPVRVIFQGADGYISPSWYPSKHVAHRQVPTWNYTVVHAVGTLVVRDDVRFLRGLVARLTRHHEAAEPKPWKMGDAPAEYIDDMLQRIVGIEVVVTFLVGKAKLGQNKAAEDRLGAAQALAARGHVALGDAMTRAAGDGEPPVR